MTRRFIPALATAALLLSLGGCAARELELPVELIRSLQSLTGPLRLTWYLSPELLSERPIREADGILTSMSAAGDEVTAVVRPPLPGERKPLSLLPLPATDVRGQNLVLWSALVLDWRENRIVIPDVLDSRWLQVDLIRALTDLASGSPLSVGILDGTEDSRGLPGGLLAGRWAVSDWDTLVDPSGRFDVLLIRDGPGLNSYGAALTELLESFVRRGGGILMASSALPGEPDSPPSPAGQWAMNRTRGEANSRVFYVEDSLFLDPSAYLEGVRHFRELDTALLMATGRSGFLDINSSDKNPTDEDVPEPVIFRRAAGPRLLKAGAFPGGGAPEASEVSEIIFRTSVQSEDTGSADNQTTPVPDDDNSFSLVRGREGWELVSGDWRLPGRSDRIESFLSRLAQGSEEIWYSETTTGPPEDYSPGGVEIVLKTGKGRPFILEPAGNRPSGGGEYIRTARGKVLWPLLGAVELEGDPRYWMERRLFPDVAKIIRAELRTDSRLYWRIHRQGDYWIFTSDRNENRFPDPGLAADFAGRLLLAESSTLAPAMNIRHSPLSLIVETDTGRLYEFVLSDLDQGAVAATSREGLQYVLSVDLANFLLEGPAPSL